MHCFPLNCLRTGDGSRGSLGSSSMLKQSRMCRQDLLTGKANPPLAVFYIHGTTSSCLLLSVLCTTCQGSLYYPAAAASALLPREDRRSNCSSSPLPASRDWDPGGSPRPDPFPPFAAFYKIPGLPKSPGGKAWAELMWCSCCLAELGLK